MGAGRSHILSGWWCVALPALVVRLLRSGRCPTRVPTRRAGKHHRQTVSLGRCPRLSSLLLLSWMLWYPSATRLCIAQQANGNLEAQVKAAYVYNLTKFVYWNSRDLSTPPNPVAIFVVGVDPIGDILEEFSRHQTTGQPIVVKKVSVDSDISGCNMLFVGRSEQQVFPSMLRRLRNAAVLTVSDIPGFTARGGMVDFTIEQGKVRLQINMSAVNDAGLKISAKLLEVARFIADEN
jgi:hypothetical protein